MPRSKAHIDVQVEPHETKEHDFIERCRRMTEILFRALERREVCLEERKSSSDVAANDSLAA